MSTASVDNTRNPKTAGLCEVSVKSAGLPITAMTCAIFYGTAAAIAPAVVSGEPKCN